jgi:hypothetical protein
MSSRGSGDICRPTLINCTFDNNWAKDEGGGVRTYQSEIKLLNCIFIRNSADDDGGGVEYSTYTSATMRNCTFVGNSSPYGRALACDSFRQESPSTVHVINCILWDGGNEIWNRDNSAIMVTYSNVQYGWQGTGNINANPSFVTGPNGDYYLSQIAAGQAVDSPCVDAGSDTAANLGMDIFTTRTDEIMDREIVDMGYHYSANYGSPDIDGNWHVNWFDYSTLAADWQNCNEESYLPGDLTKNGCVDINDLMVLLDCWLDCYVTNATNPKPADEARGVDPNRTLSWVPEMGALYHDVYFGTDANAVANAGYVSPEFMGTVSEALFDPCGLELETMYYWRIDEVGPACMVQGEVWSFKTWIEPGQISLWKFDEGSGTIAYDSTGNNNGTINGATRTTGQINGALSFDGLNDHVSVPHDVSLNITGDITISAWVNIKQGSLYQGIVTKCVWSGPTNNPYDFRTQASPEPLLTLVRADATGHEGVYSNKHLSLNQWYHVLVRVENKVPDFYVDGIITGKSADTTFTKTPTGNTKPVLIGARDDGLYFDGIIDEVLIYDIALSAGEIEQLYQNGLMAGQ